MLLILISQCQTKHIERILSCDGFWTCSVLPDHWRGAQASTMHPKKKYGITRLLPIIRCANCWHFFPTSEVRHTIASWMPHNDTVLAVHSVRLFIRPRHARPASGAWTIGLTAPCFGNRIIFTVNPSSDSNATLSAILIIQPSQKLKFLNAVRHRQMSFVAVITSGASLVPWQRLVEYEIRSVIGVSSYTGKCRYMHTWQISPDRFCA